MKIFFYNFRIPIFLALFLCFQSDISFAADIHCGRDTDLNGTVDNYCMGTCDEDFDGHFSLGSPCFGDDCDDHNFWIYPGKWVDAGSGNVKKCGVGGVYGSTVALSALTCSTGSGAKFYVAVGGSTAAGCGAIGTPCDYRCFSNSNGLACSHTPTVGDCIVQRGGTYTASYPDGIKTRQMYFQGRTGFTWISAPGESVQITGAGSGATPIEFESSNNFAFGGSDRPILVLGNFAGSAIFHDSSFGDTMENFVTFNTDGASGDNVTGFKSNGSASDNWHATHFFSYGNYRRADPRNENNTEVVVFRGTGWSVEYATIWSTPGGGSRGLKLKHNDPSVSWTMRGLVIKDAYNAGLELMGGGGQIDTNFFLSNSQNGGYGVELTGGSGVTDFSSDTVFEHNLVYDSAAILVYDRDSDENTSVFGNFLARNNVFIDTRPTAYPVGGSDGFIGICRSEFAASSKCSDALYNNIILGGKVIFTNNCHWTVPEVPPYYDVFGDNNTTVKGNRYTSFSQWVNAGWDTGSFNEDPLQNGLYLATSTHCSTFGPQLGVGGGGGPPVPDPGNAMGGGRELLSEYIRSYE